jgi:sugar transferase (PEP-CTERM/EpsH1 system associated)
MRILFLAQRVPYPPNRGDKIPNCHYIRHLAREHEIVVACLADGANDLENRNGLAPFVTAIDAVPLSRSRSRARALAALVTGARPLTVAYFDEPALRRRVRERLASGEIDLALACSSGMASYIDGFNLPRIIQFTDLDSQKWELYAAMSRFPRRWIYRAEARRLLEYERHIAKSFDYSLFCSVRELDDFHRLIPDVPGQCVRNGVDFDYFQPSAGPQVPDNLVFTGVMNYRPNVDGVCWFCHEVLPRVRAEIPSVSFTVCGASPEKKVRQLAQLPGVEVTGAVPDVRPYLARASVGIIPIRMARGIQNKLLEAMAMGLPTVTTTAVHAGLEAEDGRDLFVADEPAPFAAAVVRLLRDRQLRIEMGNAARTVVVTHYQWDQSLAQLDDVIAKVMNQRPDAGAVVGGKVS